MNTFKTVALLFVMALFTMTSCQGPKGDPGVPGHDGNANVQSSTVETTAPDWYWDQNAMNWYVDLQWDQIDFDMVDYGAVLVYMENPGEFYGWHQLPLTLYTTDMYSSTLETVCYDGGLTVFWTNSDLNQHENPCTLYNTNLTFKVVLIDANTYAKYQNEDLSDYETVKELLKLAD